MARVTHVKKAQQRYETKPVLDDNGNPVKIALTKADGSPKMTSSKGGKRTPRPVFITKTVADKSRPKPNLRCDFPGCDVDGREILPGTPYKWIKPKSGPYGGRMMARHAQHPTWQVWDYSSSLSAQVARIEHDADLSGVETVEDAEAVAQEAAEAIRELAEQKRESAGNIEDGFGHATYQSEELEQQADDLDSWADEVEAIDFPDQDDYRSEDEVDCDECQGTGQVDNPDPETYDQSQDPEFTYEDEVDCDNCGGTGQVEDEDPDVDLDEWREAAQDALAEVLGSCPV